MNSFKLSHDKSESYSFLQSFLNNTLKELMLITGADCGSLFIFDTESKELVLNALYNSCDKQHLQAVKKRVGEGVSGKVAYIKEPVLVRDIDKDLRFSRNGFSHYRTKSFISIPLFSGSTLIGLINLADKKDQSSFSEADFKIAVLVSKYACLSLESLSNYTGEKEEKESLHQQKVLLEKYASMGKLAAGVVHEINNPLDGIVRYTNMLIGQQSEDKAVSREYLLEVKKGLSRIADITRSLLEFSYQVNSPQSRQEKYIDLSQLLDECLSFCSHRLNGKIKAIKNYQTGPLKIIDFGLWQVFRNLIKNAIDAMPEGGEIVISSEATPQGVSISVKDSGCGISGEVRERLFEPFFTTKTIYKGSGLGLSICKEIIDRYHGKIEVSDQSSKGACFVVSIPRKYIIDGE